ncbi:hypothetical protein ES703_41933 [subsurface metagenome]
MSLNPILVCVSLRLIYMIQGRKSVSVYYEKGRKIRQGHKGKNTEKDTSQILRIVMDDEMLPGMKKSPEEMAQKILSCRSSEMIRI